MEESMEELVTDCHYWRQLLLGLNYQNWILETEKKSFRNKYENLVEKVKHDMPILLKLKGSQKKLAKDTRKYARTDQELATARSMDLDRKSDRVVTEMEREHAVKRLQMNTSTMERINKFHRRIQSRIEEEKKYGEGKMVKYEKEVKVLRETLAADGVVFQDFKKTFADREIFVDDLKAFVTDGLKIYLGLEKKRRRRNGVIKRGIRRNRNKSQDGHIYMCASSSIIGSSSICTGSSGLGKMTHFSVCMIWYYRDGTFQCVQDLVLSVAAPFVHAHLVSARCEHDLVLSGWYISMCARSSIIGSSSICTGSSGLGKMTHFSVCMIWYYRDGTFQCVQDLVLSVAAPFVQAHLVSAR
ncbi:uncharacterized protein CEXT_657721 [Caerostris extrusa]|uniref:Uncharacterized protein n=1 Tax=Caerostris extrusa TaxID=172846 RepID=A0AAV4NER4_CAEEX|nr:uncharacterized protein CEXT_657721 [Caerostris extrusa]